MKTTYNQVVAIGLDAASPEWIRQLIEQGVMSNLGSLLAKGRWLEVDSNAHIGSGAVWPTFITGAGPSEHGVYGEWTWQPDTMDLKRYRGNNLAPFWHKLAQQSIKVGVLDVPFMPMVGLNDGFEISEWGPHDVLEGRTEVGPAPVQSVVEELGRHPLTSGTNVSGPDDYRNLQKLGQACLSGARLRGKLARELLKKIKPDLALIAFPETHRCGHYLWHTASPDHAVYRESGINRFTLPKPALRDVYREIDRQIGKILQAANDDAAVMIFSLHGMQPAHGIPAFLAPLLCEKGFSKLADWNSQTWADRARTIMARVKRSLPGWTKKLYYSVTPTSTTQRVARSTMLPQYDWNNTRAFALPTDQHGWVRINLIGREAKGIVPLKDYDETCDEIQSLIRDLTSEDGRPLVREVVRTAARVEDAIVQRIPDLVVHWDDAVYSPALKIKGSAVKVENVGRKYVAQHSLRGFSIVNEAFEVRDQHVLRGEELHKLMIAALERRPASRSATASR